MPRGVFNSGPHSPQARRHAGSLRGNLFSNNKSQRQEGHETPPHTHARITQAQPPTKAHGNRDRCLYEAKRRAILSRALDPTSLLQS